MRVKSSGLARGLANARPPGSATFANAPPPGLTRRANAPQLPRGGWAQVELTDALLRLGKRSEDGSEMASSSTKLFEASCASKRKFFIIFGILPLSLPNVPLNWLEQTEYDVFFMEAYFLNYNLS